MSVTGVVVAAHEEKLKQVERVVGSSLLHGSESLCKLLRYLADQCIEHPGVTVKEYQIATDLFKRPSDFDPRMDATVRVQTGRLRSKLAEYYAHPGADDHWIIEIPKGAYSLVFYPRPVAESAAIAPVQPAAAAGVTPSAGNRPWFLAVLVLSLALAICMVSLAMLYISRAPDRNAVKEERPAALAALWNDFVDGTEEPWVIFSNAEFAGRPETGMHYYDPAIDKAQPIMDHYTGVGEVLAIHDLDRVFASLHHGLRVKRGRLLSLDDAKNNDLIFVGSPSENLSLRDIPTTREFVFRKMEDGPRKGDLSVVNVHAKPGEEKRFLGTAGLPLTEDYAVIGLMPGLNPARWVMVLAGLSTMGTQAAVEFVSKPDTVDSLLKRIGSVRNGKVTPFEMVLHVRVSHGVPVESQIVAARVRQ